MRALVAPHRLPSRVRRRALLRDREPDRESPTLEEIRANHHDGGTKKSLTTAGGFSLSATCVPLQRGYCQRSKHTHAHGAQRECNVQQRVSGDDLHRDGFAAQRRRVHGPKNAAAQCHALLHRRVPIRDANEEAIIVVTIASYA